MGESIDRGRRQLLTVATTLTGAVGLPLLANLIGGSTYSATTVMLRGFPNADATFVRMGLCTVLFLPFLWTARHRLCLLAGRDWLRVALVGTLGYALPLALGNYGQTMASSSVASLIIGLEPVSIVLLSWLRLKK